MSLSFLRAAAKLGRRDVLRHRARSALVLALIALPVAAMVAAIAIMRTTQPSDERRDVWRMGRADIIAQGVSRAELTDWLTAGSTLEPIISTDGNLVLPGAKPSISVRGVDLDGLGQGMLRLVEGRQPRGLDEVAISAKVAELAGVTIGGQLTLEGASPATVVGFVENETYLEDRLVLVDPRAAPPTDPAFGSWLVDVPEGIDADALVAATIDPATGAPTTPFSLESRNAGGIFVVGGEDTYSPTILVLGTLALVEAALVASAAFAVSIRRRQRELGLLAATGATPRQLAATVFLEAALLGALAAVIGMAVGILGAIALSPSLDQLTQRRNEPLVIDLAGVLIPGAIGLVAALIAALTPARTASRVPVLTALSGRRPAVAPARRSLVIGLGAVVLSIGMTLVGANQRSQDTASILLLVGGAVLGTLGFGACGPWLLERLEGVAVRLPVAGRIAFRDAARARSRSSPIVTAVLASFAATVALGTWTASRDANNAAEWRPSVFPEQMIVRGAGAEAAAAAILELDGAMASDPTTAMWIPDPAWFEIQSPGAKDANGEVIVYGPEEEPRPFTLQEVSLATPGTLRIAHAEDAASDIAAGTVVIVWDEPLTLDKVEFQLYEDPEAPGPTRRIEKPAKVLVNPAGGGAVRGALISQSLADELGFELWSESGWTEQIVSFDRPVTEADVASAAEIAGRYADTYAEAALRPPQPDAAFRMVMIVLALLFAVSVTGVAIALGEAESRPEQRSLLALGADPRLRRRIVASRAAVLTLLAGVLAVPAGLLPVWGLLAARREMVALPLPEIAGAVLALPALAVLAAWLLSRPIPDWSAFRSVRPGE